MSRHQRRFVGGLAIWMLSITIVMVVIGVLSPLSFFVLSLIGLLIGAEITAPLALRLPWRVRLRRVIALEMLVFCLVVVRRLVSLFPPGL